MSHWNETYDALAGCYDDMTEDVNYPGWADFLEKLFSRGKHPVHTVLEPACGQEPCLFCWPPGDMN